jgi:orotidine-5'-phosphate decarboxylase
VNFADRLHAAVAAKRSCLVVGLDPVLERLPAAVQAPAAASSGMAGWTARAAAAVGLFLEEVVPRVAPYAVAVKPNAAFFERFGAAGWDCLRRVCESAQRAGMLVIVDAKRGDIGHTAKAYAESLLGEVPDTLGPVTDAVTVNPYLGRDSIEPFLERVEGGGKGIFVLVRTSNPSAAEVQELVTGGEPLYRRVAAHVAAWGRGLEGEAGLSSVGAVVGATVPAQAAEVRAILKNSFLLVPGFGAQGAGPEQVAACFLPGGSGAVVNASRSILYAYQRRDGPWAESVEAAARDARDVLERVRTGR